MPVHLHVHSNRSLLEGTATVRQLVGRAVEHGLHALALTDTAGLYGAIPFYQAAREAGIKPILGATMDGMVVLARDRQGYTHLCELLTAHTFSLGKEKVCQKKPLPPSAGYVSEASGKYADSRSAEGGNGSFFASFLSFPRKKGMFVISSEREVIERLCAAGVEPLVGVTHWGDRRSRYRAGRLRDWALARGLRPVAVSPVYFLEREHYEVHRVLTAIRLNTTVGALEEGDTADARDYFRSPREMERLYGDWPEMLSNIDWVVERCNVELELGRPVFPEFPVPGGETAFSYLWKVSFEGAKARYRPLTPKVIDRLRYELDIIHQLGFAPYFLIVWDIVQYAIGKGIPVMGRGSAANSLVAYVLGITRVDPLKYDLYFERFLNLSRTDCPDIDIDLCWKRRDEVIDYVYETYGADRVAMICTFNTFRARGAVREVGKAMGLSPEEVGRITRRLPGYGSGDIRAVVEHLPESRGLPIDEEPLKSIIEISEFIDGYPRHLSIHPCGLVIAPGPLTEFVPLQEAAKGIVITQYDMGPIEDLGLVKIDLLGHRSLTVIVDTVEKLRRNRGLEVDVEALPDGDRLTSALLRDGRTIGCFQIESPAMRSLLKRTMCEDTDMLIKTIALVRPGASGSGMKKHFILRHHGKEPVEYLHPGMEEVLSDTYGVMIYQEDIMKVAHVIAGLDLAEADALRRAMSKKGSPAAMAKNMKGFIEKAVAKGVAQDVAEEIWALISNFAAYSYCKAHASSYGEVAYQCSYLKAHYPAEFMSSVLSNRGGFYHTAVYIEEVRRLGIELRRPDVNRSEVGYAMEDDAIRVGFVEIRNLNEDAVERILEKRGEKPFDSVSDLWKRGGVAPSDVELLVRAGACDGFGWTRRELMWELKMLAKAGVVSKKGSGESVFGEGGLQGLVPQLPDYSRKRRADEEWGALGLLASMHPLEYYAGALGEHRVILSSELDAYVGQEVVLAGWLIAERRVGLKDRGAMKFLTLEDGGGVYEAVMFPEAYQAFGHMLTTHGPYFVGGEVQDEDGYCALTMSWMEVVRERGGRAALREISSRPHPLDLRDGAAYPGEKDKATDS